MAPSTLVRRMATSMPSPMMVGGLLYYALPVSRLFSCLSIDIAGTLKWRFRTGNKIRVRLEFLQTDPPSTSDRVTTISTH